MARRKNTDEVAEAAEIETMEAEVSEELLAEEFGLEEEVAGFLPEATEDQVFEEPISEEIVEGSELEGFESAEIEDVEFLEEERLDSIVESVLFASDRPVTLASLKLLFKGTNIKGDKIKRAIDRLAVELAGARRGVTLEEVPGGYQIRTKIDNMDFIARSVKARQFRLSGPALEVLAIVAYKQPVIKSEIDEIRGVESGHLLRALMEKGLATFEGKSDLPGKPMQYGTSKKFLEIFGLRNLKELPTLSQIDELLPDGIGEEDEGEKQTLSQLTDKLSENIGSSYSIGEEELGKIEGALSEINTSSDFFEKEKVRQKQKRDDDKAQEIRDAVVMGEEVSNRDRNWLERYELAKTQGTSVAEEAPTEVPEVLVAERIEEQIVEAEDGLFAEEVDNSVDADMGLEYSDDEAEA